MKYFTYHSIQIFKILSFFAIRIFCQEFFRAIGIAIECFVRQFKSGSHCCSFPAPPLSRLQVKHPSTNDADPLPDPLILILVELQFLVC